MSIDPIIKETQINIMLDTNIPGEKPFSLTKNVLHGDSLNTANFSDYPYFSYAFLYPESLLNELDYNKRVAFFFDKDVFLKTMKTTETYKKELEKIENENRERDKAYKERVERKKRGENVNNATFLKDIELSDDKKREKIRQTNTLIKQNVMIMLGSIFPTNYPISDNIFNSYDTLFMNSILPTTSFSFSNILPFILSSIGLKPKLYSYIKSPSKGICTVTQVMWLNDLYNHPQYKEIVEKYEKFQQWKMKESVSEEKNLQKKIKEFKEKYNPGLKKLKELFDKITNPTDYFKQTYYGYNNINFEKEFLNAKEKLESILNNFESFEVSDLVSFKNSFSIIESRLRLEDIRRLMKTNELVENINDIEMLDEVVNEYLNNENIQMEKQETEEKYAYVDNIAERERNNLLQRIKTKWSGYSKYQEFIQFVKTFIRPNMESSNAFLQSEFENFYKNKKNQIEELAIPLNSSDPEMKPYIETGITIKSSSSVKNEIYVRMDVIAGKLDDTNKKKIDCAFFGDYLGNEFVKLTKTQNTKFWELDKIRFFFDLNDLKDKTPPDKSTEEKKPEEPKNSGNNNQGVNEPNAPNLNNKIQGGMGQRKKKYTMFKKRVLKNVKRRSQKNNYK